MYVVVSECGIPATKKKKKKEEEEKETKKSNTVSQSTANGLV